MMKELLPLKNYLRDSKMKLFILFKVRAITANCSELHLSTLKQILLSTEAVWEKNSAQKEFWNDIHQKSLIMKNIILKQIQFRLK
jgi:hypothetical protein